MTITQARREEERRDDSRDRLIRLEEGMKHINQTLIEIKLSLDLQNKNHIVHKDEVDKRVTEVEKKVDKIYWTWSAIVCVGTPVVTFISHQVLSHFGL
jgi:hypothetical protein